MFLPLKLSILTLLASTLVMAQNPALNSYVGDYPVLAYNGDATVTARVAIIENALSSGYHLFSSPLGSHPVPARKLLTPTEETTFRTVGSSVIQNFEEEKASWTIEYHKEAGYKIISLSFCNETQGCGGETFFVGDGGAPGTPVDPKEFVQEIAGNYEVIKAGGDEPKAENKNAMAMALEDEGFISAPFCPKDGTFCDPGYIFVNYQEDKVFFQEGTSGEKIYTLVQEGMNYFRWIVKSDSSVTVQNLQYPLNNELVTLEHELVYISPAE